MPAGKYPYSSTVAAIQYYSGDLDELYTPEVRDKYVADATSTATADGITVLTRVGGGRWIRRCVPDVYWQTQLEWWYDATNGKDTNSGAFGFPVKTVGEIIRRMQGPLASSATAATVYTLYTASTLSNAEAALLYNMFTPNDPRQWEVVDGSLPTTPVLRFSSRDLNGNGDGNSGWVDGTAYSSRTLVNKGSGASGNATQQASTVTYRANGLAPSGRAAIPALEFAGAAWFKTGVIGGVTGPTTWLVVFKQTSGASNMVLVDSVNAGASCRIQTIAGGTPQVFLNAGASAFAGTIALNQVHGIVASLNSGSPAAAQSSQAMIDGLVAAGGGLCGTNAAFGASIGALADGSNQFTGQIFEAMLIDGAVASMDVSVWAQWLKYNFGVLPV